MDDRQWPPYSTEYTVQNPFPYVQQPPVFLLESKNRTYTNALTEKFGCNSLRTAITPNNCLMFWAFATDIKMAIRALMKTLTAFFGDVTALCQFVIKGTLLNVTQSMKRYKS